MKVIEEKNSNKTESNSIEQDENYNLKGGSILSFILKLFNKLSQSEHRSVQIIMALFVGTIGIIAILTVYQYVTSSSYMWKGEIPQKKVIPYKKELGEPPQSQEKTRQNKSRQVASKKSIVFIDKYATLSINEIAYLLRREIKKRNSIDFSIYVDEHICKKVGYLLYKAKIVNSVYVSRSKLYSIIIHYQNQNDIGSRRDRGWFGPRTLNSLIDRINISDSLTFRIKIDSYLYSSTSLYLPPSNERILRIV